MSRGVQDVLEWPLYSSSIPDSEILGVTQARGNISSDKCHSRVLAENISHQI
jgi:hypothetical protein